MAEKLSRKQKFEELRNEIEQQALETNVETNKPIKLSRVKTNSMSHATKALYPHEDITATKTNTTTAVMEDLLGEVKQYNIDNGNRYTDDTQINILKQLDSTTPSVRNQHIMPMEEDDEDLGHTMEMPRTSSFGNDIDGIATFMPNQKLTRQNPIVVDQQEDDKIDEISFDDYFSPKDEKIVLNNKDFKASDLGDTDHLDLFEPGKYDQEFNVTEQEEVEEEQEKPKKKFGLKKKKKQKKQKLQEVVEEEDIEVPSSKIRMQAEELDEQEDTKGSKSGTILNIILVVLIVALIASIGFTVYFLYQMGK